MSNFSSHLIFTCFLLLLSTSLRDAYPLVFNIQKTDSDESGTFDSFEILPLDPTPSSAPLNLDDLFNIEEATDEDLSILPSEGEFPEISDLDDEDFFFSGNIDDYFTVEPTFLESSFDLIDGDTPIESGENIEEFVTAEISAEVIEAEIIPLCTRTKRNCLKQQRCGFLIQRRGRRGRRRRLNRRGRRLLRFCGRRCGVKAEFC